MSALMVRTKTPGIYKRGGRYVFVYKVNGRQKKESCRTLAEARRLKSARQTDVARGEFHEQTRTRFREYAEEWVERYQGRGRKGFRELTRDDYRRDLRRYAFPFFDEKLGRRLSQITPRDVANFVAWLCDESEQLKRAEQETREIERELARRLEQAKGDEREEVAKRIRRQRKRGRQTTLLSDATVRRILSPVRACLRMAVDEGLIRNNPADKAALPHRPQLEDEEAEDVRVLTREQLAIFLRVVHPKFELLFRTLAATGLRISEAIALEWRYVELDGSGPHVKVRQARVRGKLGPPKSKYGRRDVPLPAELVSALRRHRANGSGQDRDPVFMATNGQPLRQENVRNRHLRPAAEEAGAPWAGFHAFRHTCASMLFERGANAVQVQRWLGHHSPAFTLATYVHLLSDDLGEPLELSAELQVANPVATDPTALDGNVATADEEPGGLVAALQAASPTPRNSTGLAQAES
jgi:integrase